MPALPASVIPKAPFPSSNVFSSAISAVMAKRPPSFNQPRFHIASSLLCDDLLQRLGPSLKKHSSCDIIDVFPGAGLLSAKLHNHLKPRRHLLIEPNTNYYQSFLKPLTEEQDSTYKHLPWDPLDLKTYDDLFLQGHLPEQTKQPPVWSQGSGCATNDSLLVLANITAKPQYGQTYTLLLRYLEACLDQTLFHRYGLVRMIALLSSDDAEVLLPRVISRRRRSAVIAEATCSDITEVAGDSARELWHSQKGLSTLEVSRKQVENRFKEGGTVTPPGRDASPPELAPDAGKYGKRESYVPRPKRPWHDTYIELTQNPNLPDLRTPAQRGRPSLKSPRRTDTTDKLAHGKVTALHRRLVHENRDEALFRKAEPKVIQIEQLEAELVLMLQTKSPTLADVLKRVKQIHVELLEVEEQLSSRNSVALSRFDSLMEERMCFDGIRSGTKEPLLLWDKRPYEPFDVGSDEFTPNGLCSVIDFQPNPNSNIIQTQQQHIKNKTLHNYHLMLRAYRHLMGTVTTHSQRSIGDILRPMFPDRSMSSLIQSIPNLAPFARPKILQMVDSKIKMRRLISLTETVDVNKPIQEVAPELAEYDENCFSSVKVRHLPSSVLWDIIVEWQGSSNGFEAEEDIYKVLGGARLKRMDGEAFTTGFA
ncbi:uncharacterized protein BDCG_03580 [Blastomyces dermatitidis ER-3]|uniref:Uncharacterized protein n=2 Tax=Ajellomyces dermatitidis TaxID=5039 RepID=F2T1P0_AJEDA|nr:uncharacterized protein BDCG_03580 [Blastomyces dermatitidis ER-3]EEQ88460.2 hypothetical protein BDCG_03580 [Blastomyces dermatitidis ER-3]EGE77374.1 hypothetical protein BDDG_00311 [Blastomyces dermatitidis ATCC 18188]